MGLSVQYIDGQTPLDEEEKEGLRIETITTLRELDEFEQKNIEQTIIWYLSRSFKINQVLTESFIISVHRRMYGEVWKWAGQFRKTNKNIGVDKWDIPTSLRSLLDDTRYWVEMRIYTNDEIAIRFKHRLVCIHCFPNGNGRHSRLMGDILIHKILGETLFSWGAENLNITSEVRRQYLSAVKAADLGDYDPLIQFARS